MIRNKKAEFIMKDYVSIALVFALIMACVLFVIIDLSSSPGMAEGVDADEISRFYDESYIESVNESTRSRLSELQDAGFFQTLFLTTLEIVQAIPRLVGMTVKGMGSVMGILVSQTDIIPDSVIIILSVMVYAGLLWAAVYFIRRLSK